MTSKPIKEADFWPRLEYRVCREMNGIPHCKRAALWCDGFLPEQYFLDNAPGYIEGQVWIGRGSRHQEEWRFRLLLGSPLASVKDIPWSEVLPPDGVSGWLMVDTQRKRLEVKPWKLSPAASGRCSANGEPLLQGRPGAGTLNWTVKART
jgi:hypothetical protein